MRLEQLYYIVEVAQSKSISLAAEHSYLSQPAISSSISKLEIELGISLFKRTNQGMIPTEVGNEVIQKAKDIIDQIEEIKNISRVSAAELTGDINIAVEPSFCNTIMVNVLTRFKYKHPKVNLMLKEGESSNIVHDILSGKSDLGICLRTEEVNECNSVYIKKLFKDKLIAIAGKNSIFSKRKNISMEEALKQPLALYNTGYETSCAISKVVSKYGKLNIDYRFDSMNIIERVVASGTCIAFVPNLMIDYYKASDAIIPLTIGDEDLKIDIIMIWNKRHRMSLIEKELIKNIKFLCSICEFI
ncbi:LysR family transcriptional regulator [Clostridium sp.]|jgi:DNA-binding transcriptional LysR family regulator|uniref:LysR family transcriptional regulator n=1 Tax=Clostridium sp. TaxID=1506 RepID=UPI00258F302A|nr:LysR family transcriptional regulator [Clostridium sp.]MDF2504981.1 transcriptional regulator, LysR family [Clostridium sp.]